MAIKYLDPNDVVNVRRTKSPKNRSRSGYGSKLPTSDQVLLNDKRWRRVYAVCYSNAASPYIIVNGEKVFLGSYNVDYAIEKMQKTYDMLHYELEEYSF